MAGFENSTRQENTDNHQAFLRQLCPPGVSTNIAFLLLLPIVFPGQSTESVHHCRPRRTAARNWSNDLSSEGLANARPNRLQPPFANRFFKRREDSESWCQLKSFGIESASSSFPRWNAGRPSGSCTCAKNAVLAPSASADTSIAFTW